MAFLVLLVRILCTMSEKGQSSSKKSRRRRKMVRKASTGERNAGCAEHTDVENRYPSGPDDNCEQRHADDACRRAIAVAECTKALADDGRIGREEADFRGISAARRRHVIREAVTGGKRAESQ